MTFFVIGVSLSLLLSAFFSGSESGFYFVKKERLSLLEAQGNKRAGALLAFLRHPGPLVSTMLIGNNIALQLGTDTTMRSFNDWGVGHPMISLEVLTTLVLFLPFFIFGEVLPKVLYRLHGEVLLVKTVPLIVFFRMVFYPIAWVVGGLSWWLKKMLKVEDREDVMNFNIDNMRETLGLAYSGGAITEVQLDSLNQAMNISDQPVERFMTSVQKGNMISLEAELEQVGLFYESTKQPAYAVYDGRRTRVVGVIDLRILAREGVKGGTIGEHMDEPVSVPWGTPFHRALSEFFEHAAPIVFIRRDGRTVGYITWVDALTKMLS